MALKPRAQTLYACIVDGGAVILDLATQKYYAVDRSALPNVAERMDLEARGVKFSFRCPNLDELVALGPSKKIAQGIRAYVCPFLRATLSVSAAVAIFGAGTAIRNLDGLKRASASRLSRPFGTLKDAVAAFRTLRSWLYTAHDRCLFDALVLGNYLLQLRHEAQFVVGVRTRPFIAHAWVQSGTYLLEDVPEHVQLFTPVLAV